MRENTFEKFIRNLHSVNQSFNRSHDGIEPQESSSSGHKRKNVPSEQTESKKPRRKIEYDYQNFIDNLESNPMNTSGMLKLSKRPITYEESRNYITF